jgi:rubrerythrin
MFTIGDIRNIAIQIERNGEKTYREASKVAKDSDIVKMLVWMADEEKRHAEWFSDLRSARPLTAEQVKMEAMGRTLLQDMIKGNAFLLDQKEIEKAENIEEIISKSKIFEQDTILFYEFILGFLDDQETCGQLEAIIEEERNHIKLLELMEEPESCESCGSFSSGD